MRDRTRARNPCCGTTRSAGRMCHRSEVSDVTHSGASQLVSDALSHALPRTRALILFPRIPRTLAHSLFTGLFIIPICAGKATIRLFFLFFFILLLACGTRFILSLLLVRLESECRRENLFLNRRLTRLLMKKNGKIRNVLLLKRETFK